MKLLGAKRRNQTYDIFIPKRPTYIILGVVALTLIFASIVKIFSLLNLTDKLAKTAPPNQLNSGVLFENIETWKTYKDTKYGFELKYPSYLTLTNHNLEYSDQPAIDINYGKDLLRLLLDQQGV